MQTVKLYRLRFSVCKAIFDRAALYCSPDDCGTMLGVYAALEIDHDTGIVSRVIIGEDILYREQLKQAVAWFHSMVI